MCSNTVLLYMLLQKICDQPIKSLLYMERYVNDGSPSGFTWINQTSPKTAPLGEEEFFFLDRLITEKPVEKIGRLPRYLKQFGENSIFIHPDMYEQYDKLGCKIERDCIKVCPTSSSRTVKLLDFSGYIKLNYNGIIGRIDRSLTETHANFSVEMTKFLGEILKIPVFEKLTFFPEPGALVYKNEGKNINMGLVCRDEEVYGISADKISFIIPAFSFFAQDRIQEDEFLLIQLVERSGKTPEKYLLNELIYPIIDNYFNLLLYAGLQPEWHAQNLLLGIDRNYSVVSLIMRDLESIDIDQTLQSRLGIRKIFKSYPYKYLNEQQYNYQIKHSFMYDFKLGEYIFNPFIKCICQHYRLDEKVFEHNIQEYADQYIEKLPDDFFPANGRWYSFANVIVDRSQSERPYIENENVKYRGIM